MLNYIYLIMNFSDNATKSENTSQKDFSEFSSQKNRRSQKRFNKNVFIPLLIVGLILVAIIIFIFIPLIALDQAETKENLSKSELLQQAYEETEAENSCFGAMSIINDCENSFGDYHLTIGEFQNDYSNLTVDDWDNPEIRDSDCIDSEENQAPKEFCEVGDISSSSYILLQGDSFASQYLPAFDYLGQEMGVKVVVAAVEGGSCLYKNFVPDPNNSSCNLFFEKTKDLWEDASLIIFSAKQMVEEDGNIDNELFIEEMKNNINQIAQSGKKIVLFQNQPVIYSEEDACIKDMVCENRCISEMDCERSLEDSRPVMDMFYDFLDRKSLSNQVEYLKVEDIFCDSSNNSSDKKSICHSQIGGIPVYSDIAPEQGYSHVNSLYATSLGPYFINWYQNYQLN